MGSKIKPRQQRKPRNYVVMEMIVNAKGGPMRDKRERRPREDRDVRRHVREWEA